VYQLTVNMNWMVPPAIFQPWQSVSPSSPFLLPGAAASGAIHPVISLRPGPGSAATLSPSGHSFPTTRVRIAGKLTEWADGAPIGSSPSVANPSRTQCAAAVSHVEEAGKAQGDGWR
jgi:hypothetical protein